VVAAAGICLRLSGRDGSVPVGLAGLLWMTFSLAVWLLGVRIQHLLPNAVLPTGAAVTVGPGVVIAVVGGGIAFGASCARLGYRTWRPGAEPSVSIGWLSATSALLLVVLWARSYEWLRIDGRRVDWTLGADAIPGIGDAAAAAVVALFAAALALAITARRWLAVAVVVLGTVVALLATVAGLASVVVREAAERVISSLGMFKGEDYRIRAGIGPWLLAAAGLMAAAYGLVRLRHVDR
jgi:hypothetical protein